MLKKIGLSVSSCILALVFVAATTSGDTLDRVVVEKPTGAKIDEFLTRLEKLGFSGAIIVGQDGHVVLQKAYGYADPVAKRPYTIDTASTIGSITKQFTAAGIMALEQDGKLSVNDPITKYFKDVPADKQSITLHQLLTHSAGFPGAIGDDLDPIAREPFVRLALARKLLFAPGTRYEYSNVGYSLLAAIIEKVTGKSYEQYLHDRLFVPAGMVHTGYRLPKWDSDKLARGMGDGELVPPFEGKFQTDDSYWHLRGNGGIMTIPADMYRWHLALLGDKVLNAASRKKIFTPYVKEGQSPSSYGYGWAIFPLPGGHTLIAHNGGNGIFAADFRRYIDDGLVIFITSNISDKPSIAVDRWIGRMALGQEVPMPPKIISLPLETLRADEGMYGIADAHLRVTTAEGALRLTPTDAGGLALLSPPAGPRQPRLDAIAKRSQVIADGMLRSDFKPLQAAFGGQRDISEIEVRQKGMRARMEAKHGPLKSATVIGSRLKRDMLSAIVRLDFEHGNEYLTMMWDGPDDLVGLMVDADPPATTFLPTSPDAFAAYDFLSGESNEIRVAAGTLTISGKELKKQ